MTSIMASTCRNPQQSGRKTRLYARMSECLRGPRYLSLKREVSAGGRQYWAKKQGCNRVPKALRPRPPHEPSFVQLDPAIQEFSAPWLVWHFLRPLQHLTE